MEDVPLRDFMQVQAYTVSDTAAHQHLDVIRGDLPHTISICTNWQRFSETKILNFLYLGNYINILQTKILNYRVSF